MKTISTQVFPILLNFVSRFFFCLSLFRYFVTVFVSDGKIRAAWNHSTKMPSDPKNGGVFARKHEVHIAIERRVVWRSIYDIIPTDPTVW